MNLQLSPASLDGGRANFMCRDRFEVNQYVRVQVSETRFAIGVVTAIDEDHDKATVETRNGYEVTLPISALRRAFLVVLDLNGVLVARGRGSFILRPHVAEFLKFVFSNFVVAVWTSGLQRSSNPIIEHVFGSYRDLLLFTLFRDACVSKATPDNPYGTEKNLQTIFDRYPLSFHAVNTIIIDDSPDKCSHPDIALCPVPFKDPVAQSQDDGLMETMETLQQVLLLDSGAPLILAAEERLHRMAEQQKQQQESHEPQHDQPPLPQGQSSTSTPPVTAPAASPSNGEAPHSPEDTGVPPDMEEVELWKTRLCCENLLGKCTRGATCPFSHDVDDGRPCSRKGNCCYHSARWPKTSEEAENEMKRRQLKEANKRQHKIELEKRKHEQQQQNSNNNRGQPRRQPDLLRQLQQSMSSSSGAPQRERGNGGGRQRQDRRRQRGGRHEESLGEEEDWASGTTGPSHTGNPAYDNMIQEQLQQQRQNAAAAGGKDSSTQGAFDVSVLQGRSGGSGLASPHATPGGAFNEGPYTSNSSTSHNSLSSGYRRLLQHHNQNSTTGNSATAKNLCDVYPQSHEQPQRQHDCVTESVPFFFQSALTTATTTTIEPFSTRPIAPSPPSVQPPSTVLPASLSLSQGRLVGTGEGYRQQQQQPRYTSSASQLQKIHISGSEGDSNAVVNQLQALLRNN